MLRIAVLIQAQREHPGRDWQEVVREWWAGVSIQETVEWVDKYNAQYGS